MIHDSPRLNKNNFDLLRVLFATTVCLVHAYWLSGFQELKWIDAFLSSSVAVRAFFVVSGFLVFMSYERSSSLKSYTFKRIRRIYPAYFTMVVLCAVLLVLVSSKNAAGYFSGEWVEYLIANLAFLNFVHPTLPGVFEDNLFQATNGALWTIKVEVMFYMSVPLFVCLFRRFSPIPVILIFYCLSVAYSLGMAELAEITQSDIYEFLGRQLPGQLAYFMAGAALYYFLPTFERRAGYAFVIATLVLAVDSFFLLPLLEPFALAVVVIFFGLFMYAGNVGKYGDFSYGIYILHFPIIQVLLDYGDFRGNTGLFLFVVVLSTTLAAIFMWNVVEKRFLLKGNHYVNLLFLHGSKAPHR